MILSMLTPDARAALGSGKGSTLPRLYATVAFAMAPTDGDGDYIESLVPAWPELV